MSSWMNYVPGTQGPIPAVQRMVMIATGEETRWNEALMLIEKKEVSEFLKESVAI